MLIVLSADTWHVQQFCPLFTSLATLVVAIVNVWAAHQWASTDGSGS